MDIASRIKTIADETGFSESGYVAVSNLKFYDEIRRICEENTCRNYATSWACPPAIGTIDECRARVSRFDRMLLISRAYKIEDSFDFEGMAEAGKDFKRLVDRFQKNIENVLSGYLLLSNEGCFRCAKCTYPDAPCRFENRLHHSIEGYGFIVSELAREANIRYNNGPNTVTYFGAVLFNEEKKG